MLHLNDELVSTSSQNKCTMKEDSQLNANVVNVLEKVTVLVPLSDIVKIPSQMNKEKQFLNLKETKIHPFYCKLRIKIERTRVIQLSRTP